MSRLFGPQGDTAQILIESVVIDNVPYDFPGAIGTVGEVLGIIVVPGGGAANELDWITISAAPIGAQYLTLAADATLTDERVFTASTGLTAVDGGAGSTYTLTVDLSTGVSGGQTEIGGTGANDNLTIQSTSNATKGFVLFTDGSLIGVGAGATTPLELIHVERSTNDDTQIKVRNFLNDTSAAASVLVSARGSGTNESSSILRSWALLNTADGSDASGHSGLFQVSNTGGRNLIIANRDSSGNIRFYVSTTSITSTSRIMELTSAFQIKMGLTTAAPVSADVLFVAGSVNDARRIRMRQTGVSGTVTRSEIVADVDASEVVIRAHGLNNTGTRFGQAIGASAELIFGNSLQGGTLTRSLVGNSTAVDLFLGTNNLLAISIDGITQNVGIGVASADTLLHVEGGTTTIQLDGAGDTVPLRIMNLNQGASNNSIVEFRSESSTSIEKAFAEIRCTYTDHTNTSEDSLLDLRNIVAGLITTQIQLGVTGVLIPNQLDVSDVTRINLDGGSLPAISADTGLIISNTSAVGDNAEISIIAGNTGKSTLNFGDTDDEDTASIELDHNLNNMDFMVGVSSNAKIRISASLIEFNRDLADVDTRIRGDTITSLLYVNAGTDQVGVGTDAGIAGAILQVIGNISIGSLSANSGALQLTFAESISSRNSGNSADLSLLSAQTINARNTAVLGNTTGTDVMVQNQSAARLGFYATTPAARPTGVAVTAAGIHAALVTLGLITA